MPLSLPDRPAQHFIDELLLSEWDASNVVGFDPRTTPSSTGFGDDFGDDFGNPDSDALLPVATSLSNVGAGYPSLVVQYSSETSGGESTYDYITPDGPGQNRTGTLLVIARAESEQGGYSGDPNNYADEPARDLVVDLVEEVERICATNAAGGSSDFQTVGSQRGPEAPDDDDVSPPVRIANAQIDYTYLRSP
jgi:hypothetical protein